jgi:hypothetical protein
LWQDKRKTSISVKKRNGGRKYRVQERAEPGEMATGEE